eukprot:COSAG01_NODE_6121_length_3840_cov_2.844159_1_plen_439_part_00
MLHAPFNPFWPIYVAERLGRPQSFAAAFRAAETLAQTLASFAFGVVARNTLAKFAMVVAMLNTSLAASIFLLRSPPLLMLAAVVHGALSGVASSVASLYLVTLAPADQLGCAASLQYVGNTLGSAVGGALGGWIIARHSFSHLAVLMFLGTTPVLSIVVCAIPALTDAGAPCTLHVAGAQYRVGGGPGPEKARQTRQGSLALLQRPAVRALLLVQWLRTVFWGCASMSIPFLLNKISGSNKQLVGWYRLRHAGIPPGLLSWLRIPRCVLRGCDGRRDHRGARWRGRRYSLGSLSSAMVCMVVGGHLSDRWTRAMPKGAASSVGRYDTTVASQCLMGLAVMSPLIGCAARRRSIVGVLAAGWLSTCLAWTVSGQISPLARSVVRTPSPRAAHSWRSDGALAGRQAGRQACRVHELTSSRGATSTCVGRDHGTGKIWKCR